jgi:chemotaxis protein MotB
MVRTLCVAALAASAWSLTACGIPEAKYQAALAEASRSIKRVGEERQRAEAAERKAAELDARLTAAEQRNRDLASRLAEQERAAWARSAPASGIDPSAPLEANLPDGSGPPFSVPRAGVPVAPAPLPVAPRAEPQPRSVEYQALLATLAEDVRAGRIQLSEQQGRLPVRLAERVLFPTGSATVSSDGRRTLRHVADVLRTVKGRAIRVEGHTDSIPVRTDAFPSNWELSTARASAVVRVFQEQGINPAMLGGAGFADSLPIATNETSEGRAQNRRIDITLAAPVAPPGAPARTPMIFPINPAQGTGNP